MKKIFFLLCMTFICFNADINNELLLFAGYLRPTGTSDIISRIIDVAAKIFFKIKSIFTRN